MITVKRQSGFTLVEVLLVITIFAIILASSFSLSNSQIFEDDLQAKILEVSALVERARNNSATGYRGDVWGIKVLDNNAICENSGDCIAMFKGRAFSARDASYDAFVQFDSNVTGVSLAADQSNEFYFDYHSGWLSTTTSIVLRESLDDQYIVLDNSVGESQSVVVDKTGFIYTFVCGQDQIYDSEGNAYNTIKIGTQCWMSENLNIGTMLASVSTNPSDNGIIEKWCYDNSSSNCDLYGGLYGRSELLAYEDAAGVQGICPSGWHIPSDSEFDTLEANYPSTLDGYNLKIGGPSGFDWMLAGMRNSIGSSYTSLGTTGGIWSSTPTSNAHYADGVTTPNEITESASTPVAYGLSARCIKDY